MDSPSLIKFARNSLDNASKEIINFISEHASVFQAVDDIKLCGNCDYFYIDEKDQRLKYHRSESGDLFFDLASELNYHRSKNYSLKSEPLAKALALKSKDQIPKRIVYDVTAGTGKDLILIYSFGAHVIGFERNPIVFLLLKDALKVSNLPIELYFGDSRLIDLTNLPKPDVIFYDPMYPEKKKSALPRKEMKIFKEIIGPDMDSNSYLEFARAFANDRVVVKRSIHADRISDDVTASYEGKSTRYDMYKIFN